MESKDKLLVKSIMAEMPQIAFVVDQVGAAIDIAKKELTEEELVKALEIALEVAKYAKETSQEHFFKYNLVVIAILMFVPDVTNHKNFDTFETVSNLVGSGIKEMSVTEDEEKRGNYKGLLLKLARLYNSDQELFLVEIINLLHSLKEITTKEEPSEEDLLNILGYAYVETNLRLCNFSLLSNVQKYYNKFMTVFEKGIF